MGSVYYIEAVLSPYLFYHSDKSLDLLFCCFNHWRHSCFSQIYLGKEDNSAVNKFITHVIVQVKYSYMKETIKSYGIVLASLIAYESLYLT